MRVSPIIAGISFRGTQNPNRNPINRYRMIPLTGYLAMGGGVIAGISGFRHNRVVHKVAAAVALVAAMAPAEIAMAGTGSYEGTQQNDFAGYTPVSTKE